MVKHLDRNRSLTAAERSLTAVSHGLVMQHEALQKGVSLLGNWLIQHDEGSPVTRQVLCDKINYIFESVYNKIQQRRNSILHYVLSSLLRKRKFTRDSSDIRTCV